MGHPEFIPTRRSLLERLRNVDDADSWREFFQTYWKLIYATAKKAGLTDSESEDVVQETLISVSKSMPGFHYDGAKGSFKSWLLGLTSWRIIDQFRRRARHENGRGDSFRHGGAEDDVGGLARSELEAIWDEEWQHRLLETAMQRVKDKANVRDYQIFDLAVNQQWPIPRIAGLFKVDAAHVSRCKHRVLLLLKSEVEQLKSRYV